MLPLLGHNGHHRMRMVSPSNNRIERRPFFLVTDPQLPSIVAPSAVIRETSRSGAMLTVASLVDTNLIPFPLHATITLAGCSLRNSSSGDL